MTRPETHTSEHPVCCGNCKWAQLVEFRRDLLCCHGDQFTVEGGHLETLNGIDVFNAVEAGGDEYDRMWAGRVVGCEDSCSEWEPSEA